MGSIPIVPPAGNRFATPTPDDYSASIWIVTILSLAYSFCTLGVRLVIKHKIWNWDDFSLGLGYLLGVIQWICIFTGASSGLGKAVTLTSSDDRSKQANAFFTSRIFFVLALCFSKTCVLIFTRQLFTRDMRRAWITCNIVSVIVLVWAVASVFTVAVGCSPGHIQLRQENSECPNDVLRLQMITAFDILTEIALVAIPGYFIWNLHMDSSRKLLVVVAFAFRLPGTIFSGMYLRAYANYIHGDDRGVKITSAIVWQEVVLGYSFISATIPCLKGFIRNFATGGIGYTGDMSGSGGRSQFTGTNNSNSYPMNSMKGTHSHNHSHIDHTGRHHGHHRLRPEPLEYSATVFHEETVREDASTTSQDSQQMIIRRDFSWKVHDS